MYKLEKPMSFRQKCEIAGASYENARRNRRKYKDKTDEEIIEYTIKNQEELLKSRALNDYCRKHGINRKIAYKIRQKYKYLNIDELISIIEYKLYKKEKIAITFKYKCEQEGLDYNTVKGYKRLHPELTDEQVINYYKKKYIDNSTKDKKLGLKKKCIEANVNYQQVWNCKKKHPELTEDQIIIYYNPRCYINIFGELVIPD